MRIIVSILALITGGYMLLDGIYVLVKGKYIGPEKPGPWANLFYSFNIDVFRLGPLFIFFGALWFCFLYAFWSHQSWAYVYGMAICVLTLWYLPVGTLFSLIVLAILFFENRK